MFAPCNVKIVPTPLTAVWEDPGWNLTQRRHISQWLGGLASSVKRGPKSWSLRPEWLRVGGGVGFLRQGSKPPPCQLRGLGECCKLAQWSPGRSYGKMLFWCMSGIEKSSNLDISQLVGRFQLLELGKTNRISQLLGSTDPSSTP